MRLLRRRARFPSHRFILRPSDFENPEKLPSNEFNLLCWTDMNLRHVSDLLRAQNHQMRYSVLTFTVFFADFRTGEWRSRIMGRVGVTRASPDDQRTFQDLRFRTGDYVSVSTARGPLRKLPKRDDKRGKPFGDRL